MNVTAANHVGGEDIPHPDITDTNAAEDAIWVLSSTIIVFTMQSGFGLLESGVVSKKDEVNIMIKNVVDVIVGGLSYWGFGYAICFGVTKGISNGFMGWGDFLLMGHPGDSGVMYAQYIFQSSFATTATTIVSGAMAERVRLTAYSLFSFFNTVVYSFPAHWVFSDEGWLKKLGMVDIAGDGPVHLVGGATGLVAAWMLGPRFGRYNKSRVPTPMASPTNALLGTFMLWWGWLGFNCGSTLGVSSNRWKSAAKSAVSTTNAATGGGMVAIIASYVFLNKKIDVCYLINGILGSLVSVTAICAVAEPWEGFVIGCVGAAIALTGCEVLDRLKIDDPVGCVGVHGFTSMWGLISVGLFLRYNPAHKELGIAHKHQGLLHGGTWYMMGIQTLGVVIITLWSVVTSYLFLKLIDITVGLRVTLLEEELGADYVMHGLTPDGKKPSIEDALAAIEAITEATEREKLEEEQLKLAARQAASGVHRLGVPNQRSHSVFSGRIFPIRRSSITDFAETRPSRRESQIHSNRAFSSTSPDNLEVRQNPDE